MARRKIVSAPPPQISQPAPAAVVGDQNGAAQEEATAAPSLSSPLAAVEPAAATVPEATDADASEEEAIAAPTSRDSNVPAEVRDVSIAAMRCEEELVAATDESDAATDEAGSASADEPPVVSAELNEAAVDAAAEAKGESEGPGLDTPPPDAQRKRKRAKRLGFSGNKPKSKRTGGCLPLQVPDTDTVSSSQSQQHQNGDLEAPDSPLFHASAALYPSAPGDNALAWDWSMSDTYYDPIVQANVDQLVHVRKSCANIVAANVGACRGVQQLEAAQLATMLRDATNTISARVRPLRRGRQYRDAWEEEDFLHVQRKRDAFLGEKKHGFGDQDALVSNHELVHGYDDELFRRYIGRLEAQARHQQCHASDDDDAKAAPLSVGDKNGGDASEAKRKAKVPPLSLTQSVLPDVPVHQWHPAAWGSWTMKKPTMDFGEFHPASLSRRSVPSRGAEESTVLVQLESERQQQQNASRNDSADANDEEDKAAEKPQRADALLPVAVALWGNGKCDTTCLPSYGSAVEEDEISLEIAKSLTRLIPLSMFNWRLAQTVYERAGVYAQCSSVLAEEARLSRRIEALYQRMYPPRDDGDEQEERVQATRVPALHSRRTDLVTHSQKFCRDSEEARCVAASVEYALTLQVGDEVDVLDRNGCWNDGVVVDVFRESGQVVKFVLLRLSLWDTSGSEWVSVTEGRILPRGVADGKTSFMIGPTRSLKRRTEFNRALADTLEKTLPVRHVEQNAAAVERKRAYAAGPRQVIDGKVQKKKTKRAL